MGGSGGRWEGGSRGRGHMYTYELSMLMYVLGILNMLKDLWESNPEGQLRVDQRVK